MNYDKLTGLIKNSNIRSEYASEMTHEKHNDPKSEGRAIPMAFNNMEKDLYSLGEALNELNNRLRPISRSESPEVPEERNLVGAGTDVPMVTALALADKSIRTTLSQVRGIIDRLEI